MAPWTTTGRAVVDARAGAAASRVTHAVSSPAADNVAMIRAVALIECELVPPKLGKDPSSDSGPVPRSSGRSIERRWMLPCANFHGAAVRDPRSRALRRRHRRRDDVFHDG